MNKIARCVWTGVAIWMLGWAIGPAHAEDEIYVAPRFVTAPVDSRVAVPAGQMYIMNIAQLGAGGRVLVEVQSENKAFPDITALVMDRASVQAYAMGQRIEAMGFVRKAPPMRFVFNAQQPGDYVLLLDNRYSMLMTKQVAIRLSVELPMRPDQVQEMKRAIGALVTQVRGRYDVPSFGVRVQPCGMVNAFSQRSNGQITLCTEMIAATLNKPGAFLGIVYHELGHSLLNLWGLPGYDNEDTADEFAVQLAVRNRREAALIDQFAAYFESSDPWMEARSVIERGDRHTIGVQRSRNIRTAMRNAKEVAARWNAMTYPRMTNEALSAIVSNAGEYESAELAAKTLAGRRGGDGRATEGGGAPGIKQAAVDSPPFERYAVPVLEEHQLKRAPGESQTVNYAGRYAIQVHSCGTGCRYYSMRDLAEGRELKWLDRFAAAEPPPVTKEGYPYLTILHSRPNSALLVAQFEVTMPSRSTECWEQTFLPAANAVRANGPLVKRCSNLN